VHPDTVSNATYLAIVLPLVLFVPAGLCLGREGLLHRLAREEVAIHNNPGIRVIALLQRIFATP
jgi:hypothetical protein|tara:strand:+ start:1303 stop:1494 length:192 start_codon:yes stop_codon:yes gene_type:complete